MPIMNLQSVVPSDTDLTLLVALLGVTGTLLVAVTGAWVTLSSAKRERRRLLYSEAIRAALAWEEMLFRVRRRSDDQTEELIARFHEMQEELAYYSAWIGSDSAYMKGSYENLVRSVKSATERLITEAWEAPNREPPGNKLPEDTIPDLTKEVDQFLGDVRDHLSPWLWRRVGPWRRNRE